MTAPTLPALPALRALPALLVLLVVLSGCLSPGEPAEDDDRSQDAASEPETPDGPPALDLHGTGCFEGGGHSVHPVMLNPLPEPWTPADVLDDVGDQLVYSEIPDPNKPVPERGNTMGNYHATMICDDWTLAGEPRPGMMFGFVGMKVQTPPFGEPGPSHEYLVTVVATSDADVAATLAAGGIHAMISSAVVDEPSDGLLSIHMETDRNGVYDSVFVRKDLGPMHAPWVRLWFQQHGHDGTYQPVALDLFSEGGTHFGAEGQGVFAHTETDHHAPLPGIAGHTAALGYDGFDRSWAWGPKPDVVLDAAYHH